MKPFENYAYLQFYIFFPIKFVDFFAENYWNEGKWKSWTLHKIRHLWIQTKSLNRHNS